MWGSAPGVEHGVLGGPEAQQVPHLVAELGEVLAQVAEVLQRGLVRALHLLPRGRQVPVHQAAHDLLVVLVALLLQVPPLLGTARRHTAGQALVRLGGGVVMATPWVATSRWRGRHSDALGRYTCLNSRLLGCLKCVIWFSFQDDVSYIYIYISTPPQHLL